MEITKEQLVKLGKIRKELVKTYNEKRLVNYTTLRDIDNLIESILK